MKVAGAVLLLAGLLAAGRSPVTRLDPPAKPGALGPNLSLDHKTVLLSWLEPPHPGVKPQEGNYALRFSRLENGRWSKPETVASGTDFFANWADFPSVTPDASGRLLAHWAAKSGGEKYAYDVRLALSNDRGRTWKPLGTAHDDKTPTEHGFVSAVPEGNRIRLFWLDGREMASGGGHGSSGGERGSMALRTALVGEKAGESAVLDSRVCECCQTAAAATADGPVVVYRDRTEKEVRDISIVRRGPRGWTSPKPVHGDGWEIGGCPVNGPAIAAAGRQVAVAWYTQAQEKPSVQIAFSKDSGATFGEPIVIDAAEPLGRVDLVLDGNGDALVAWVAAEGKAAAIRLRRVTPAGRVGPSLPVAATEASRSSGFPRVERAGDTLVVAWVEASEPSRLRAATIPARELRGQR